MTDPKSQRDTTAEGNGGHTLIMKRVFAFPREAVFRAWTEPDRMVNWWGPDGCTAPLCEIDLRPGGAWRTCIRTPEGAEHYVGGVYAEIRSPERLVFSWAWETDGVPGHEMVVTLDFHDRDGSTELVLTQTRIETRESRDQHEKGWSSSFECLDRNLSGS